MELSEAIDILKDLDTCCSSCSIQRDKCSFQENGECKLKDCYDTIIECFDSTKGANK